MLLGIGTNGFFTLFLRAMHVRVPDLTGDADRVTDVGRELYGLALNLPRASIILCEFEFVRAISCRKASRNGTNLRALVFFLRFAALSFLRVAALSECWSDRQAGNRKQVESQLCRHRNLSLPGKEQTINDLVCCLAPLLTKKASIRERDEAIQHIPELPCRGWLSSAAKFRLSDDC